MESARASRLETNAVRASKRGPHRAVGDGDAAVRRRHGRAGCILPGGGARGKPQVGGARAACCMGIFAAQRRISRNGPGGGEDDSELRRGGSVGAGGGTHSRQRVRSDAGGASRDPAPAPFVAAPSAPPERNSTVEAARRRVRGPTLTEQRMRAAADAEKAEEKRLEMRKASKRKAAASSVGEGVGDNGGGSEGGVTRDGDSQIATEQPSQRRGRARLNAPLATGVTAAAGGEFARRSRGLEAAGEYRRSKAMRAVGPAGGANFSSAPDRPDFGDGVEADDEFEQQMLGWVDGNLNDAGVEARTLDARELKVGMFGDFCETRGHGKYVEWVLEPLGWKVQPVKVDGVIAVPRPVMIMDWVLRVREPSHAVQHEWGPQLLTRAMRRRAVRA